MLSKYVRPGSKLEIQQFARVKLSGNAIKPPVYKTTVYDIISENRLEIIMPMVKSKIILLPVDSEQDLFFYTDNGLYQCLAQVIDRYKENNVYLILVELKSNLQKFQRREYYRFSCSLEMGSRLLEKEEVESIENEVVSLLESATLKSCVIVDISGGGLRFVADYAYEPGMLIHCNLSLNIDGKFKEYNLVGKVLNIQDKTGVFEHRIQFVDINTQEREEIIRFIFEEERRNRRKERW